MPIAQHSSRMWDWCMAEDENQKKKSCGIMRLIKSGIKNIIKYRKIKLIYKG